MCTLQRVGSVYLLTLTGADDHRLTPTLLSSITAAVTSIPTATATALITTASGRYFSNGLSLSYARLDPTTNLPLLSAALRRTITAILSLPFPTIAAVTGHAAAAGLGLVLAHDYVYMRTDRGLIYMPEVDLGLPFQTYFMELIRAKIKNPSSLKKLVLGGVKVSAVEAVEMGIVDRGFGSGEETVEAGIGLGEELAGRGWDGQVYRGMRRAMLVEVFDELGRSDDPMVKEKDEARARL